jgi:methyltransferase (TIGR00027 family)
MDWEMYPFKNISDTARWMAYYRMMESERPDAHFHDQYARFLAGERGKEIARSLPWGITNAWAIIVRTCVFDEIIVKTIENHTVDTILDLGAGFDTRPYRLPLPLSLQWIEVDLPEILSEKEEKLVNEQPHCCLTRVKLDLADVTARRALFSRLAQEARKVLVVTEGLLIYLTAEQVTALANDLHIHFQFRWWLTDLVSPLVLRLYQLCWASQLAHGNVFLQFAPEEGERFFCRCGWHVAEFRSTMEEASRLNREMPFGSLWQLLVSFSSKAFQETYRKMSCFLLLEQAEAWS